MECANCGRELVEGDVVIADEYNVISVNGTLVQRTIRTIYVHETCPKKEK